MLFLFTQSVTVPSVNLLGRGQAGVGVSTDPLLVRRKHWHRFAMWVGPSGRSCCGSVEPQQVDIFPIFTQGNNGVPSVLIQGPPP